MTRPCTAAPASLVDAVRARIAPLFPEWSSEEIEELVSRMAELEWRYQMRDDLDSRPPSRPKA